MADILLAYRVFAAAGNAGVTPRDDVRAQTCASDVLRRQFEEALDFDAENEDHHNALAEELHRRAAELERLTAISFGNQQVAQHETR